MWFTVLAVLGVAGLGAAAPEVTLDQGLLRGVHTHTLNGRTVSSFLGVPYAQPPARFQRSQPPTPWTGVWNATKVHSNCMMFSQGTYRLQPDFAVYGTEDCLYLDVHTPKVPKEGEATELMPVLVYIHGGCFMFVYGGHHGPKYLLDKNDVLVVHINYRMGILGFLSTGDEVLPGNNGLKDQSLALHWIKKNIAKFGGDPNRIMITGTSAGGASVHYHYLSPLSKGQFASGISMSGTSLVPWAQTEPSAAKERAHRLARLVGCPAEPTADMVACLNTRPASMLVHQTRHFLKWFYNPFSLFGPVVEGPGEDSFLPEQPRELIKKGLVQDLPWVASWTLDEGLYPAAEFAGNKSAWEDLEENFLEIAPYLFDYTHTLDKDKWDQVSTSIKQLYLKDKKAQDAVKESITMMGDRFFTAYIVETAKLQSAVMKSPVHSYQFTYRGTHSTSEALSGGDTTNFGTSHGDDTSYVFERNDMNPEGSANDLKMSQDLVSLFVNFASKHESKFPGASSWDTVNSEENKYTYLDILGPSEAVQKREEDVAHHNFWMSLPLDENNP